MTLAIRSLEDKAAVWQWLCDFCMQAQLSFARV